jgi:hypothetical protein
MKPRFARFHRIAGADPACHRPRHWNFSGRRVWCACVVPVICPAVWRCACGASDLSDSAEVRAYGASRGDPNPSCE